MKEISFVDDKQLREQAIDQIDVLEKVKHLFLIPELEVMTVKQVAEYYEVSIEAIQSCYKDNKKEIDSDGVYLKPYKEFLSVLKGQLRIENGRTTVSLGDGVSFVIPRAGIKVFPQRAILRIGMLLRDSPIAQEVRTQLLNTFEESTLEQKTNAIDEELEIQVNIGKAIMSGDIQLICEAHARAFEFKNRHIKKLEEEKTELVEDNKALTGEILAWEDRSCLNKAIRALATARNVHFGKVWNELYDELRYKHHIGLPQRGKPPYIQHIKENEWPLVQQSLSAICEVNGISASKIMKKAKYTPT